MSAKKRTKKSSHEASRSAKPRTHRIQFCAIKIDETAQHVQEWLARGYDRWVPTKLWNVYIVRPNQPSYVGSLAPKSFAMYAYSDGELPPGAPEEIRAKLSEELLMVEHEDGYLDFKIVQGIIKDGKDARDLGMFVTTDEDLDECRDAWEAARVCLLNNQIL